MRDERIIVDEMVKHSKECDTCTSRRLCDDMSKLNEELLIIVL